MQKMRRALGQGLIETLMIILFVSIGIVALLTFQHSATYSSLYTRQQADATILAQSQLETLLDYQVVNTTSGYTAYQGIATGSSTSTVGNTTYTLSWTVTAYTSPTYKNINITVSWTDLYGVSQSVQLTTNVAGTDPSAPASFM